MPVIRDRRPSDRTPRPISATMAEALRVAQEHGGILQRLPGGFWTWPGCPSIGQAIGVPGNVAVPEWWVGTGTMQGLITRNLVEVTKRLARGDASAVRLVNPEPFKGTQ